MLNTVFQVVVVIVLLPLAVWIVLVAFGLTIEGLIKPIATRALELVVLPFAAIFVALDLDALTPSIRRKYLIFLCFGAYYVILGTYHSVHAFWLNGLALVGAIFFTHLLSFTALVFGIPKTMHTYFPKLQVAAIVGGFLYLSVALQFAWVNEGHLRERFGPSTDRLIFDSVICTSIIVVALAFSLLRRFVLGSTSRVISTESAP